MKSSNLKYSQWYKIFLKSIRAKGNIIIIIKKTGTNKPKAGKNEGTQGHQCKKQFCKHRKCWCLDKDLSPADVLLCVKPKKLELM